MYKPCIHLAPATLHSLQHVSQVSEGVQRPTELTLRHKGKQGQQGERTAEFRSTESWKANSTTAPERCMSQCTSIFKLDFYPTSRVSIHYFCFKFMK